MAWPADSPMIFDIARQHLAVDYDLVWSDGNVTGMLVDTGAGSLWTPSPSDDFIDNILAAGAVETSAARTLLPSPVESLSGADHCVYWDSDPLVISGVLVGETFDALVLFEFVSDDTDSYALAVYDLGSQTGDGSDVEVDPDARGWIRW